MQTILLSVVLPLLLCVTAAAQEKAADLVLLSGNIITVDDEHPRAQALAARDELIVAVGTDDEIRKYIGPRTRVVQLDGKTAIPGFIEGHGHFTSLGYAKMILDLRKALSWQEIETQVAAAAQRTKPGEWIVGRGWHQSKWKSPPEHNVEGYPIHFSLSRLTPDNPVLLTHASGHACFANAAALKLAGINRETPDPEGGEILRDADGEPSGVLRETAQSAVQRAHAAWEANRSAAEKKTAFLKSVEFATEECLSKGITSFQDAGSSFGTVDQFKVLADQKALKLRLWVMLRTSNAALESRLADYRLIDYGNRRLTVRAIKRMADGALGSHGALLLEPYSDLPEKSGLRVDSMESIRETALLAAKHDFQLCVHAIGDRANREVLDLIQEMYRSFPDNRDRRWRIEHAQIVHPADIPRFAEIGVIASMQANHATSDAPFAVTRLGEERARRSGYVWRSLLDTGTIISNGTDAPVEDVDPLLCYHAAVTRRLKDGSTFFPDQKLTRMEALKAYTIHAAYAAFEEKQKGSLTPGKLADVAVLSQDILTVDEKLLRETKVLYTIVGGAVLFSRKE